MNLREHVIELLPAYALNILDEAETVKVSLHISECESCRAEFEKYQKTGEMLSLAVPEAEPPPDIKRRIMAHVNRSSGSSDSASPASWRNQHGIFAKSIARAWVVVSLVLVAALLVSNIILWQQVRGPQITDALQVVALSGGEHAPAARGMLTMSLDGTQGTVVVDGLEHFEYGLEYQLWLFRENQPSSGGTFMVYRDGYGYKKVDSEEPLMNYERFTVTIEPEGGSLSPLGPVVLEGDI